MYILIYLVKLFPYINIINEAKCYTLGPLKRPCFVLCRGADTVQAWAANPPDPHSRSARLLPPTGLSSDPNTRRQRHPNVQMSALDARFASGRRVPSGPATEPHAPLQLFRSVSLEKCVSMSLGGTSLASTRRGRTTVCVIWIANSTVFRTKANRLKLKKKQNKAEEVYEAVEFWSNPPELNSYGAGQEVLNIFIKKLHNNRSISAARRR